MGKQISYQAMLVRLDILYGDGIFFVDDAMRKHKQITGSRAKWKDPVPGEVISYIEKKYGIKI